MKIAWTVLIISALTDFIVTMGTGLTAAMLEHGSAVMPSNAVWLVTAIGGAVAAARTIQQALKATPEQVNLLKGN